MCLLLIKQVWGLFGLSFCLSPDNMVEQDHRRVKHLINPGMSFGSFNSARRTIKGYEAMNTIRKGQIENVEKGDIIGQISFINQIFGLAT